MNKVLSEDTYLVESGGLNDFAQQKQAMRYAMFLVILEHHVWQRDQQSQEDYKWPRVFTSKRHVAHRKGLQEPLATNAARAYAGTLRKIARISP